MRSSFLLSLLLVPVQASAAGIPKVDICHFGNTISVPVHQIATVHGPHFLSGDDHLGPCEGSSSSATSSSSSSWSNSSITSSQSSSFSSSSAQSSVSSQPSSSSQSSSVASESSSSSCDECQSSSHSSAHSSSSHSGTSSSESTEGSSSSDASSASSQPQESSSSSHSGDEGGEGGDDGGDEGGEGSSSSVPYPTAPKFNTNRDSDHMGNPQGNGGWRGNRTNELLGDLAWMISLRYGVPFSQVILGNYYLEPSVLCPLGSMLHRESNMSAAKWFSTVLAPMMPLSQEEIYYRLRNWERLCEGWSEARKSFTHS